MKKVIILFVIILLIPIPVFAETGETDEEIMQTTQDKFNITQF